MAAETGLHTPLAPPMPLDPADVEYVRREFVPLDEACRSAGRDPAEVRDLIRGRQLPGPPYVLPDGTEMVPTHYFELLDEAGTVQRMREVFVARYERAVAARVQGTWSETAEEAWQDYLDGTYFVCVAHATPENILEKSRLVVELARMLHDDVKDDAWRDRARPLVDALDHVERPFARYDRVRFGPTSRDRLIDEVRSKYL